MRSWLLIVALATSATYASLETVEKQAIGESYTEEVKNTFDYVTNPDICGRSSSANSTSKEADFHAGYVDITLKPAHRRNKVWFWHFEAEENPEKAPLVIILGGEAGVPVTDYVFGPTGPCAIKNGASEANPYHYHTKANLLYIDPVPIVGFSYIESDKSEVETKIDDSSNFHAQAVHTIEDFLLRFREEVFPQYREREILIWGWDRGATTAIHLASTIHNLFKIKSLILISPYLNPSLDPAWALRYGQLNPYNAYICEDWKYFATMQKCEEMIRHCFGKDGSLSEQNEPVCSNRLEWWEFLMEWPYDKDPSIPRCGHIPSPFNVTEKSLDKPLRYLYQRPRENEVAVFLNSEDTREKLGLKGDNDHYKPSFPLYINELRMAEEFLIPSEKEFNELAKRGVEAVVICGEQDVATSCYQFELTFGEYGLDLKNSDKWSKRKFRQVKDEDQNYIPNDKFDTVHPIKLSKFKKAKTLSLLSVPNAGHDVELQEPALLQELFNRIVSKKEPGPLELED